MPVMRLFLLLCALLLTGCGTYYNVSVDSLRDAQQPSGTVYFMQPGNEGVSESDLLFREVVRQITPAFRARGYAVVDDIKNADNVAVVSYWMDEPRVHIDTDTITRTHPVVVGRGRYRHVEYVYVDEPVVTSTTIYTANLLIEAYVLTPDKKQDRQIWRTSLRCSSGNEDFRTLMFSMAQVLPGVMGTQSNGLRQFEVFLGNDGEIEVTDKADSLF
ncbi:hypothetical protein [uncultured Mailhella sp.]|uniref:hypothetical protein n=1 Tax=uncultured Mailhella sp. TaxID=1981031 RepID=UPI0025CF37B5|nr:hypothetical protein [uncultured Mailhella sp.]